MTNHSTIKVHNGPASAPGFSWRGKPKSPRSPLASSGEAARPAATNRENANLIGRGTPAKIRELWDLAVKESSDSKQKKMRLVVNCFLFAPCKVACFIWAVKARCRAQADAACVQMFLSCQMVIGVISRRYLRGGTSRDVQRHMCFGGHRLQSTPPLTGQDCPAAHCSGDPDGAWRYSIVPRGR